MQAVIMAGGKGTRLLAVTNDEIPKPMAPVSGKPILQWQVECLLRGGVHDIIMVTGHLGEKIEAYFGNGSSFGTCISYYHETQPLGTAGALAELLPNLEDDFFLVFGDVIFDIDLSRMIKFHKENRAVATLFVHPNSHPFDSDLVLHDDEARVTGILTKNVARDDWYDNCVNAGFYIIQKALCQTIQSGVKTDLEKSVLLPCAESGGAVYAYASPEYIKDVGTPERITAAEKEIAAEIVSARNLKNRQKCIFIDRDGTINRYRGLLSKEEDFELEDFAVEAIRIINQAGWLAIVITNQPVVARGLCDIADVNRIHNKLKTLLGQNGVFLDDVQFCPHHPDNGYPEENPAYKIPCDCRKPGIGMITRCVEKYNIDMANSWIVGDTTMDIQTGINAGLHTALVMTGKGGTDAKYSVIPELIADNLLDAIRNILEV